MLYYYGRGVLRNPKHDINCEHYVERHNIQMKSIINSKTAKDKILIACDKAIDECALQHNQNIEYTANEAATEKYPIITETGSAQPLSIKITFELYWETSAVSQMSANQL